MDKIVFKNSRLANNNNKSWHLHICGQVQGVGYRPLVYNFAKRAGIKGWVKNDLDGLHVKFNASEDMANEFKTEITSSAAPPMARVTKITLIEIERYQFQDFKILHDDSAAETKLLITPDISLCQACKEDLNNADERRHEYPFISCSHCGPRYSITEKLPYDRINTTMAPFTFCNNCLAEYEQPTERRYYAQTNSCPSCGIAMQLYDNNKEVVSKDAQEIIELIVELWNQGKTIAIKGIGGYILACDATNSASVEELRNRKQRPSKPFAIMLPDLSFCDESKMTEQEISTLQDHVSPISLIDKKAIKGELEGIADGLDTIGIMLPYAPIYAVLLNSFKKPIVATSANFSDGVIIHQDESALSELTAIADYILTNNRRIVVPQDDSVLRFTPREKHKIILRRSRGLAPTFINDISNWNAKTILSMGAQLKSTFSLLNNQNVYISQYLGDLDQLESFNNYKIVQDHIINLLDAKPSVIVVDKHPGYQSTLNGNDLAKLRGAEIHEVQHHIAHFSAIIGEHNLINITEPLLGVIWDGIGLGDDGNIWGGEFFIYQDYQFRRCHHLPNFAQMLNDKMAKEPRLSALSVCKGIDGSEQILQDKFTSQEWKIYGSILENEEQLQTSSMGRLFDAVASLLGIMDKQSFEGEAAMQLEVAARNYFIEIEYSEIPFYDPEQFSYEDFSVSDLVSQIIADIKTGKSKNLIAAKFHGSLVKWIEAIAKREACSKIAFSGGVFQNALLVDLLISSLKNKSELYFHEQLSPNDENISFGQLINYEISQILIKKT